MTRGFLKLLALCSVLALSLYWTMDKPNHPAPVAKQSQLGIFADLNALPFVSPPDDPPPGLVRINGELFLLAYVDHQYMDAHNLWASSNFVYRLILIDPKDPPDDLRDTVVHEILHMAARSNPQFQSNPDEEQFIRDVSSPMITVMRDNPDLMRWLTYTPEGIR